MRSDTNNRLNLRQKWHKPVDCRISARKEVKNKELWIALDEQVGRHIVEWRWVKGHSGHRENEIADELANKGIDALGGNK